MRPVTRSVVAATLVVLVLLLSLGALPQFLRSGDPYYLEATVVDEAPAEVDPVNASTLVERQYPYTFDALAAVGNATDPGATGRSEPYWKGPVGFKEAFTHSLFDERAAYGDQYPGAVADDAVYLRRNATTYRLEVIHP